MELEIIKHKDILFKDIIRVIDAKSVAWPYSFESQVRWIKDNLNDEDEHVLMREGSLVKAYMNLIKISCLVNNTDYMTYGIGNVCSVERGKGLGKELMNQVDSYLKDSCRTGLLFCRLQLVSFYSQFGWVDIKRDVCDIPSLSADIHVMTYLVPETVKSLVYHGELF